VRNQHYRELLACLTDEIITCILPLLLNTDSLVLLYFSHLTSMRDQHYRELLASLIDEAAAVVAHTGVTLQASSLLKRPAVAAFVLRLPDCIYRPLGR
jgi:hypothetical protein